MKTQLQPNTNDIVATAELGEGMPPHAEKSAAGIVSGDITGATNVSPKRSPEAASSLVDGSKKTWGEKAYNTLVYKIFGFGVNLGVSSFLTYLTLHSNWKVPLVLKKPDGTPRMVKEVYTDARSWFETSWVTKNIKGFDPATAEVRKDRANVMAGALVLTFGGHIMIPVIKFFEDKKTSIITWLDNKHYGADAEKNPEIAAAHARIAEEIRPTLLSTALARVGSVVAVQLSARTFGIDKNLIKKTAIAVDAPLGKGFDGFDRITEGAGLSVAKTLPESIAKPVNSFLLKSSGQPVVADSKNQQTALLLKYGFSDIIYTIITAVSIKPMNNWLIRNFSFLRKEPEKKPVTEQPASLPLAHNDKRDTALDGIEIERAELDASRPTVAVQNGRTEGVLHAAPELQKA